MAELPDPTLSGEETYDYGPLMGERPPLWLPFNQGDVFEGIDLPGVPSADEDRLAMIFMHPCTMRTGVALRPLVTMVQVHKHSSKKANSRLELWDNLNKVMPLPMLMGSEGAAYCGDFMAMTSVPSSELRRERRVASLTLGGRNQFQQRIIFHLTRFAPNRDDLRLASRQLEHEMDMQTEWMGIWCEGREDDLSAIDAGEQAFEEFMRELVPNIAHIIDPEAPSEISRRQSLMRLTFTDATRAMHATLARLLPGA